MSEQQINKLHADLATLQGETARQKKAAAHILESAEKMIEGVDKRLAEIHPSTDGDEYQRLLEEKGVLLQVIQQARLGAPKSDDGRR